MQEVAAKTHRANIIHHIIINVSLITLIIAIYCLITDNQSVDAFGSNIIYKTNQKNSISMECIVAWDSEYIDSLLNVLEKENVKITFVLSGAWCEQNSDMLRRIAKDEHKIATCSMNYSDTQNLKTKELAASINKSIGIIENLSGKKVSYYYCPTNDTSKAAKAAKIARIDCVRCSVDLLSARGDEDSIVERAKNNANDKWIVAFTPTMSMINALPTVFEHYRSAELEIIPVVI